MPENLPDLFNRKNNGQTLACLGPDGMFQVVKVGVEKWPRKIEQAVRWKICYQ
jgi:hypothetical protein